MTTQTQAPVVATNKLDLLRLADDELFVGHILTSIAGFGPELEINLALSSIGQDELGHARNYCTLIVGTDRDSINELIFGRDTDGYRASQLATVYTEDWSDAVVKHFLYDTADAARMTALGESTDAELAAVVDKAKMEELFHVDFWTTWLAKTAAAGPDSVARIQSSLERFWPMTKELFEFEDPAALGVEPARLAAAYEDWSAATIEAFEQHGVTVQPLGTPVDVRQDRQRIVDELQFVYREAPGSW